AVATAAFPAWAAVARSKGSYFPRCRGCRPSYRLARTPERRLRMTDGPLKVADGPLKVADGRPKVADGRPKVADGRRKVAVGRRGAEDVHAQQRAVDGVHQQLQHAVGLTHDLAASQLAIPRQPDLVRHRLGRELGLGGSDVRDLGDRVDPDRLQLRQARGAL